MLYWGIVLFICIVVFVVSLKALNKSCWDSTLYLVHTSYCNSSTYYCIGNAFNYLRV